MKKLLFSSAFLLLAGVQVWAQDIKLVNNKYQTSSGEVYSGDYKESDSNGKLTYSAIIKNGVLDGSVVYFYPSGNRKETGSYREGLKHGVWERYEDNGVKTAQGNYNEGKKDGVWLVWDANGVKRFEMKYKDGEKVDTWFEYDSTGSLTAERTFNMASK